MMTERSHSTIKLRWTAVVALILMPLLVVAGLVGTTWRTTDRLGQVKAAVVNEDKAVKVRGQLVPMGRQLTAELVNSGSHMTDGHTVDWTLTDADGAAEGLRDGTYSVVVTIPTSFSADATSYSANDAAKASPAVIDVTTSQTSPVSDTAVAALTAQVARRSLNTTLTSGYLENVYIGFNQFAQQMKKMADAAAKLDDGATKLADGTKTSAAGAATLAAGMTRLDDGARQLQANGGKLTDGVSQLSGGLHTLSDKGQQLSDGANGLASGVATYTDGTGKVVDGIGQLSAGLTTMDQKVSAATAKIDASQLNQLTDGASQLADGIDQFTGGLVGYRAEIRQYASGEKTASLNKEALSKGEADFLARCQRRHTAQDCQTLLPLVRDAMTDGYALGVRAGSAVAVKAMAIKDPNSGMSIDDGIDQLSDGSSQLSQGVDKFTDQMRTGLPTMVGQIAQLRDGIHQSAVGAQTLATKSQQLKDGGAKLSAGAATFANGVDAYTGGVSKAAASTPMLEQGVSQYVGGVNQLADGVAKASAGAGTFASGMAKLNDGAQKLADGTGTFSHELSAGATKVPTYSQDDRTKLADVVATPVNGDGPAIATSVAAVAVLLILGAWIAALATWLVVRTVPSRVLRSARSTLGLVVQTMSVGAIVTIAVSIGLAVVGSVALGLSLPRSIALGGLLLLVGAMFGLVNHTLAAWLHGAGRLISVVMATASVAAGLASTVPAPVHWVDAISPLRPSLQAVQAVVAGNTPSFGSLLAVVIWAVAALIASLLAVGRRRQISAKELLATSAA
ncbi:YhgE/Pip domain-containing protein [Cutibacterium sp. WCA-380-WT-3A]|uniref:YhgE/Pip domain-containing protein n=1 Tax=Cutibacterium porci TaxID=2605781 RepID=A0A7K0J483_9ACTN|nr:YhgE/Pip domain-containing protein [Cutibacterium porci]MSS44750.1 YhgE/Pip domain-containing protein [Cutibacterium porci]